MLFTLAPATRDFFPINMEVQRGRLVRALVHIVQQSTGRTTWRRSSATRRDHASSA